MTGGHNYAPNRRPKRRKKKETQAIAAKWRRRREKEWKDKHGMPDITKTRSTNALHACRTNKHKKQKLMHRDTFQREKLR